MIFIAVITYNLVLWWQTITVAMTAYTLAKQAYTYIAMCGSQFPTCMQISKKLAQASPII